MRLNIMLTLPFILASISVSAQKDKYHLGMESYEHTVTLPEEKITLHVVEDNQLRSYTDLNKTYYWYSNNQIKTTQGGFSGKLLDGRFSRFYLNKNLKELGEFNAGLKTGTWKNWADNGTLLKVVSYKKGTPNGKFFNYKESGALAEEGKYKEGKINGLFKKYINPDSVQILKYKNGIIVNQQPSKISKWLNGIFHKKIKTKPSNKPK